MVKNIAEFEYIVTDSEMEALILECNLIKKYSPKYNISLKDDKFYPFIKVTTNEDFPRVFITRNYAKDGNKYFGPYPNAGDVHETINLIRKIFPLRTCKKSIIEGEKPTRACLNYHIKKCNAPCEGRISKTEYKKMIDEIMEVLSGKDRSLLNKLKEEMQSASGNLEFEKAASLRDKMIAIENIAEKQKVFKSQENDEDFINIYKDEKDCCIQVFFLRDGKITGREHFMIENSSHEEDTTIISQFIISFYGGTPKVPKNIYIPESDEIEALEEFLSIKRGSRVFVKVPIKGEKKEMLELVKNNAKVTLDQFKDKILRDKEINMISLKEIQELLELDSIPLRIEAYDISNIQGVDSVGSMIVFENGKAKNSDYRRFRIKTVKSANDYDSMRENFRPKIHSWIKRDRRDSK